MRIAVIGDDGVGKSTLITCLFRGRYVPQIEDQLPTLFFPRNNDSSIALVDTSPSLDKRKSLLSELRHANCIWLVYSDHYTMERISLFWLPFLRENGVNLPIILCQNKQDHLFANHWDETEPTSLEDEEDVIQLMQDFKEIESFVRCSAKAKCNVNEAFFLCQRAILYPLAPLFDSKIGHLKPLARQALSRIFFLYDEDQSGYLTTAKLQKLQFAVFQNELDDKQIRLIQQTLIKVQEERMISDSAASSRPGSEYLQQQGFKPQCVLYDEEVGGITADGFLTLAQLYCERGRHETIWGILRHSHYTDSLSLDDKFLRPSFYIDPRSRVELSPDGYQFLVDLFTLFDMDNDGGLSPEELDALFTPTPGLPSMWIRVGFPYSTLRNDDNNVTLQGWLAQWSMFVYLDHTDALAYIAMLGYTSKEARSDIKTALKVTKPLKKRNPRSRVYRSYTVKDRQVFNCLVFGATGSGKSTLMSSFLGARAKSHDAKTVASPTVVNTVEMPGGKQIYLILHECGSMQDIEYTSPQVLEECDVICLAYDSSDPDSFAHLVEFRNSHKELDDLPLVFAALKADQDRAQQRCDIQPDEYTSSLGIAAPMHISSNWPSSLSALFVQIVEAAMNPGSATVVFPNEEHETSFIPDIAAGLAVGSAAALAWWWTLHRNRP